MKTSTVQFRLKKARISSFQFVTKNKDLNLKGEDLNFSEKGKDLDFLYSALKTRTSSFQHVTKKVRTST